ncbi:MAG: hypothetical protein ACYDHC_08725 [Desulfuromonadaceae bacterium]
MRLLTNNKGIALVTSLMLTLISLTIVMYLLLMITSGTKVSGANKRYRTALEASYGATNLVINDAIPLIFTQVIANGGGSAAIFDDLYPASVNFTLGSDSCVMDKLTKPTAQWGVGCSNTSDPKVGADFTLNLNSTSADSAYAVSAKIVDSECPDKRAYPAGKCTGSDLSGYEMLDGGQGSTGGSSGITPKAMPATYRIEIIGEKSDNPKEKSRLSVLYAY